MNVIFEKATPRHVASLEVLARSTFSSTFKHLYTAEDLAIHLDTTCSADFFIQELSSGCHINIACIGTELIGYIKFGKVGLPVNHATNDAEIHRLYMLDSYQNLGIGRKLMHTALDDSGVLAASNLFVGVWEHNKKAQVFYKNYNFKPVGEYDYFVGAHADREIIMSRAM